MKQNENNRPTTRSIADAVELHRRGELDAAAAAYRSVLARDSTCADAWHGVGLIAYQKGQYNEAVISLGRAIDFDPSRAHYHNHLGEALRQAKRPAEAVEAFQRALALKENFPEALNNLGLAWRALGRLNDAAVTLEQAVVQKPDYADAISNLGVVLQQQGRFEDALHMFRKAAAIRPDSVAYDVNLALACEKCGRIAEAISILERRMKGDPGFGVINALARILVAAGRAGDAIRLVHAELLRNPCSPMLTFMLGIAQQSADRLQEAAATYRAAMLYPEVAARAANNLGAVLRLLNRKDEAMAVYRQACELDPLRSEPWSNLGVLEQEQGNIAEAVRLYSKAISLSAVNAEAHNNLGNAWSTLGESDRAIQTYNAAIRLAPGYLAAQSNRLMSLLYSDSISASEIESEHRKWGRQFGLPPPCFRPSSVSRAPAPVRVGILSADFRIHPVSKFFEPLLRAADRRAVRFFAYADVQTRDSQTDVMRGLFDKWTEITAMSDGQAASRIAADEPEVLIELGGHTSRSRLMVCAYRPAPVQVSYLGYPSITGLPTIDYRFTDCWADPVDGRPTDFPEKLVRLPRCAWCYQPPRISSEIGAITGRAPGEIRFGSFNALAKLSPATVRLWAAILSECEGSTLYLKSRFSEQRWVQDMVVGRFASYGVEKRIRFLPFSESAHSHYNDYKEIDIALDPFPYNGTTTTCDALWMGVPVITLAGNSHVSRVGVSLLRQVDLESCIADDPADYIARAVGLGRDPGRLENLRSVLRPRMMKSPLTDALSFSREFVRTLTALVRPDLREPGGQGE